MTPVWPKMTIFERKMFFRTGNVFSNGFFCESGRKRTVKKLFEPKKHFWAVCQLRRYMMAHPAFNQGFRLATASRSFKYKGNIKGIHRKYKGNTKGIQRKYKGNTKELQRKYKGNMKKYKGNTKEIQRTYK